jgi:hypothetical protein
VKEEEKEEKEEKMEAAPPGAAPRVPAPEWLVARWSGARGVTVLQRVMLLHVPSTGHDVPYPWSTAMVGQPAPPSPVTPIVATQGMGHVTLQWLLRRLLQRTWRCSLGRWVRGHAGERGGEEEEEEVVEAGGDLLEQEVEVPVVVPEPEVEEGPGPVGGAGWRWEPAEGAALPGEWVSASAAAQKNIFGIRGVYLHAAGWRLVFARWAALGWGETQAMDRLFRFNWRAVVPGQADPAALNSGTEYTGGAPGAGTGGCPHVVSGVGPDGGRVRVREELRPQPPPARTPEERLNESLSEVWAAHTTISPVCLFPLLPPAHPYPYPPLTSSFPPAHPSCPSPLAILIPIHPSLPPPSYPAHPS